MKAITFFGGSAFRVVGSHFVGVYCHGQCMCAYGRGHPCVIYGLQSNLSYRPEVLTLTILLLGNRNSVCELGAAMICGPSFLCLQTFPSWRVFLPNTTEYSGSVPLYLLSLWLVPSLALVLRTRESPWHSQPDCCGWRSMDPERRLEVQNLSQRSWESKNNSLHLHKFRGKLPALLSKPYSNSKLWKML